MRQWPVLTKEWTSRNGLTVVLLGNTSETEAMGRALHNGLQVPSVMEGMNPYPPLCERGARQIFGVKDAAGNYVANGFLAVGDDKLSTRFIRGDHNVEITEGPAFEAVSQYVYGINAGLIPTEIGIRGNSFVVLPPVKADASPQTLWERSAVEGGGFISQFRNFVKNVVKRPEIKDEPTAEPVTFKAPPLPDGEQLPVLTAEWKAPNGLDVMPLGNRDEFRVVGEELENFLMMPAQREQMAGNVKGGRIQYVALCDKGGPIAVAELKVVNGQVTPSTCRMRAENDANEAVIKAVTAYTASINAGIIPTNYEVGGAEFVVSTAIKPTPVVLDGQRTITPELPKAMRTLPEGGEFDDDFDDDDLDDDLDDDEPETVPETVPEWPPLLREPYLTHTGYEITTPNDEPELVKLGEHMENALSSCARMWTRKAEEGLCQFLVIKDTRTGEVVGNSELVVREGRVEQAMGLLKQRNAPADEGPKAAVDAFLEEVNEGRVPLNLHVTSGGFDFDTPVEEARPLGFRP